LFCVCSQARGTTEAHAIFDHAPHVCLSERYYLFVGLGSWVSRMELAADVSVVGAGSDRFENQTGLDGRIMVYYIGTASDASF